jgi:hypothetical protein
MSATAETVKRGPGRPRTNPEPIVQTQTVAPTAEAVTTTLPTIPDHELENYGGDIAAWDSVRPGMSLKRRGEYEPGTLGFHLPDLNPPGTLVHRHNPDLKFHFGWWDDTAASSSRTTFVTMAQKGYKVALASDFIVCPELRFAISADANDRLTFAPGKDGAMVVMYQSEADYRANQKRLLRDSDYVQASAEERAARLQDELRRGGLTGAIASTKIEDDFS